MIIKEGCTKNVIFVIKGVLVLERCHKNPILKMHGFLLKLYCLLPGINQTNEVDSNDDQRKVFQNSKFHVTHGWGC